MVKPSRMTLMLSSVTTGAKNWFKPLASLTGTA